MLGRGNFTSFFGVVSKMEMAMPPLFFLLDESGKWQFHLLLFWEGGSFFRASNPDLVLPRLGPLK